MIRFLFKQSQPKRFNYKPRFYSETKEYLESREAIIKQELDMETGSGGEALRSRMNHSWRAKHNRSASMRSNRNVLLIIGLLAIAAYFLLYR